MNEELKIIISAVTNEAKKNLAGVKEELKDIDKASEEAGQAIDKAMKGMAKGAAAAVAVVTALTAAMSNLGKKAQEVQKGFDKLNTTFQNHGSTTAQATNTYKQLFGFLGEHDKAVEAAQSLALITTEEKKLAEWSHILQGAFAEMGEKLPTEGLAEAINETYQTGKVTGVLADALTWAGVSEDGFNAALAQTTSLEEREVLLRSTLNGLYGNAAKLYARNNQATIQYNQSQASLNLALASASAYTTPFLTSVNNLGTSLLTVLSPALQTITVYLTGFIQLLAEAIQWVGSFFGLVSSAVETPTSDLKGYQNAMSNYLNSLRSNFSANEKSIDGNIEKLKELKKQTMGFDELNVVSSATSSSSGGATGGGGVGGLANLPAMPNPEDYGIGSSGIDLEKFNKDLEEAKGKIKAVLVLVGLVAAGFAAWKIGSVVSGITAAMTIIKRNGTGLFSQAAQKAAHKYLDDIKTKLKGFGGMLLVIAGAIMLVQGYSDAWVNGIDWGNFALMVGGIALIIGGMALAVSPLVAGITAMAGGIALIVIGIKDFVTNGYSMQNVLTILAGVIAVVVGVCLAFNAALLANPITWIVIGIAALVAAFVILWNECEGFRNFWKNLWAKVKELFKQFINSIKPLIDALVGAFKEAWELIKVIWNNYLVPLFKAAWEAIKAVWDVVKPYFEILWNSIKTIFSVVKEVLVGFFKGAWEGIKFVWDVVVSYFTMIFNNIKAVFSVIKNVLTGNFKDAWEGIKSIFSNVGNFFSGVVSRIKELFGNIAVIIGNTISNVVKKAINGVLSNAVKIINGFISAINLAISVINAIPGVNIKKLNKLDVPQLAKGGIVNSATLAVIGERGKEAVMPLENNTGWMDTLAERIANKNGSPSRIVLMLDGKELGYATLNSINNITRQTGVLPLVLA